MSTAPQIDRPGQCGSGVWLYGGEVLLRFDPRAHSYEVTDRGRTFRVPSVTTILSVVDKSAPLAQWAANCVVDYLRQKIMPGQAYDEIALEMIFEDARFNFRRVSGEAKAIGSLVHDWIERWLKAKTEDRACPPFPVNEKARRCCEAAMAWVRACEFHPLAVELKLYSRRHRYAGTMDSAVGGVALVEGQRSIVDWKTSGGIYPEYRLQTAAYAQAYEEMTGEPIEGRWVVRLGKHDGAFEAMHFSRKEQAADFRAFLAAMRLYQHIRTIRGEA
jgi:hypothetical protein